MNRRIECKQYRIREELEDVLDPWPMKTIPTRTLSDLDVTLHGAHLPRPIPVHRTMDMETEGTTFRMHPLRSRYLTETVKHESEPSDEKWVRGLVDDAMQALQTEDVLPPDYFAATICEHAEEPDGSWETLKSESEAFDKFEAFRRRLVIHFSDDGLKTIRQPKMAPFEISLAKKTPDMVAYVDKRCNDRRKMVPRVYAAPPYPEYWLPKKKKVIAEETTVKEISTSENIPANDD